MWLSWSECVDRKGLDTLAKLSLNASEILRVGAAATGVSTFETPLFRAGSVAGYVNGTEVSATLVPGAPDGGLDRVVFTVEPSPVGAAVGVSSPDAVNTLAVRRALSDAQTLLGTFIRRSGKTPPEGDADPATVPDELKGYTFDIALYYLVTNGRSPLDWHTVEQQFYWLVGGGPLHEAGFLNGLVKSGWPSLSSLSPSTPAVSPKRGSSFNSERPHFGPPFGGGVW